MNQPPKGFGKEIAGTEGKVGKGILGSWTNPSTTKFCEKEKKPAMEINNPKNAISLADGLYGANNLAT